MKAAKSIDNSTDAIGTGIVNFKSNGKAMKSGVKRGSGYNGNGENGNGHRAGALRHSRIIQLKHNLHIDDPDFEEVPERRSTKTNSKLEYDDRLFITVNSTSRFIKVSNIQCITAEKDYTYICTADDKKLLVLRPMIEWEGRLPDKYFARIHRSTIVNLDYVEKVEKWFNYAYHVYITGWDEPFQMSRRYASKIKERFR